MKKYIFVMAVLLCLVSCSGPETPSDTDGTSTGAGKETTVATADITTENTTTEQTTTAETTEATTTETPPVIGDYQVVGDNGILVINRNNHYMGLMPCWGTYEYLDSYIDSMNNYAKSLKGLNIYSMVIPTNVEFYLPDGWENFSSSQKEKIDYIGEGLINVMPIDAYGALAKHKSEEIYSRTDHHWFPLGAYYAAEQFAIAAGFDFPDLSTYEKVTKGGYVGSLYNYSNDINLYNDPEDFTMYMPDKELAATYYDTAFSNGYEGNLFVTKDASAYYCSFLGSDQLIAKVKTGGNTKRTLVVFKESYGNALIPFLADGFDTIYVCDIRYFDLNAVEFCKEVKATDVLFATCTFTPAGVNNKFFEIIRTQGGS